MADNSKVSMYHPSVSPEFQKTNLKSPFEYLMAVIYTELLISLHMPHPWQEFWMSVNGTSTYPICQVKAWESVLALLLTCPLLADLLTSIFKTYLKSNHFSKPSTDTTLVPDTIVCCLETVS